MTPLPPDILRAICERPHETGLRLIAADWLEEAGESESAEFIRAQCELAELGSAGYLQDGWTLDDLPGIDRGRELRRRERELWGSWPGRDDIRSSFHAALPGRWCILPATFRSGAELPAAIVQHGWIEEIHCRLADWAGEVCLACEGRGATWWALRSGEPTLHCDDCDGAGLVGGHGPAIVACQPVLRLVLVDLSITTLDTHWLNWARKQAGLPELASPAS